MNIYKYDFTCFYGLRAIFIGCAVLINAVTMGVVSEEHYNQMKNEKLSIIVKGHRLFPSKELFHLLIQREKIDVKLLEPYSDWLFSHPQAIAGNWRTNWREELLFFNNDIKIYGAYTFGDLPITMDYKPFFKKLLLKYPNYFTLNKTINLRLIDDGYYFNEHFLAVNQDASFCIAQYWYDKDKSDKFDLINLKTLKTIPLDNNIVSPRFGQFDDVASCCFGQAHELYTINTKGVISRVDLANNVTEYITTLEIDENQRIKNIVSNNAGDWLAVATSQQVFIITPNLGLSRTKFSPYVDKISLNHSGSQLCIATRTSDASYSGKIEELFLSKREDLFGQGLIRLTRGTSAFSFGKDSYLSDIILQWTKDDTLLYANCNYGNTDVNFDHHIGSVYTFIVPQSGNSWYQKALYKYIDIGQKILQEKRIKAIYPCGTVYSRGIVDKTISQDGKELIITVGSGWNAKTTKITLCDDNMQEALRYFDMTKKHELDFKNQRFLGILLLHTILRQQKGTITLDETETRIYLDYLPRSIKAILSKSYDFVLTNPDL